MESCFFQELVLFSNHFLLTKQQKDQKDFIVLQLWGNTSLLFNKSGHVNAFLHPKSLKQSSLKVKLKSKIRTDFQVQPLIFLKQVDMSIVMMYKKYRHALR